MSESHTLLAKVIHWGFILLYGYGILKQIELDVLKLRFAIGVPKTLRQSEVAKELGITTGRVSQIEKKALTKLRNRIEIIE